ncbi:MAG: hypothetical protein IPI67_18835 [Myxococcales bacterium]|nr:hypothetical protein [Myxococcales bacterium]
MLRRRSLTLVTVGLIGSLSAFACGGSSDDSSNNNTGGSGGSTTGKPDPEEPGARPPAQGSGAPAAGAADTVVALNKLFLGDTDYSGNPDPNAWRTIGYNLDGLVSTKNGTNHCKYQEGATKSSVQTDGENGIDNSFGSNLVKIIASLAANPSSTISESLASGSFTIMLKMNKLEASADQTGIKTLLYGGSTFDALVPDCKATPTEPNCSAPKFDGSDMWPVLPELLTNATDIDSAKVQFPSSYVAGGTWVSGSEGDLNLTVSIQGFSLALKITKAVITADLAGAGATAKATKGVIAGIIPTENLIGELKKVAGGFDKTLCEGQTFESIAQQIRAASDIMSDGTNGDPSKLCDGISVGLGFEALAVQLGGIAPSATPPPDPCAAGAGGAGG